MPRKRKKDIYWTDATETAIIEYNSTDDFSIKNKIYTQRIKYPFEKLSEYMINTFKFPYIDISKQDMQNEVVSILLEKIHMYEAGKGKSFSYFSIIAKNHLILKNTGNYKRFKQTSLMSEMPENWNPEDDFYENQISDEYEEFTQLMLEYWDRNLTNVFIKKRDIQIADAVLELFRRSKYIENYNKKHLYLLIREMTDCKTHYITKVVNEMKKHQTRILNQYLDEGFVDMNDTTFWQSPFVGDDD